MCCYAHNKYCNTNTWQICNETKSESDFRGSLKSTRSKYDDEMYTYNGANATHDTVYDEMVDQHDTTSNIERMLSSNNASYVSEINSPLTHLTTPLSKLTARSSSLTSCPVGESRHSEYSDISNGEYDEHSMLTSSPLSDSDSITDIAIMSSDCMDASWQESNPSMISGTLKSLDTRISSHHTSPLLHVEQTKGKYTRISDDDDYSMPEAKYVDTSKGVEVFIDSKEDEGISDNQYFENQEDSLENTPATEVCEVIHEKVIVSKANMLESSDATHVPKESIQVEYQEEIQQVEIEKEELVQNSDRSEITDSEKMQNSEENTDIDDYETKEIVGSKRASGEERRIIEERIFRESEYDDDVTNQMESISTDSSESQEEVTTIKNADLYRTEYYDDLTDDKTITGSHSESDELLEDELLVNESDIL